MEYKDTLLMPKTKFEMRGKLPTKEPGFQKRWKEGEIYEKMLENREGCEAFVLHDGPPYANGDIHLGHALNKILKDVIVRNRYMAGYKVPYVPGWDTHGLKQQSRSWGITARKWSCLISASCAMTMLWNRLSVRKRDFYRWELSAIMIIPTSH